MKDQNITEKSQDVAAGCAPATGSVIPPGLYANGMGGWFEVRYSNLPDDPGYDQGAPGVGITWGREKWYVLANSKEHFWAQWPYSMFRNCPPVSPNEKLTYPPRRKRSSATKTNNEPRDIER